MRRHGMTLIQDTGHRPTWGTPQPDTGGTRRRFGALMWALLLCCLGPLTDLAAAHPEADAKSHDPRQEARVAAPQLLIAFQDNLLSVRLRHAPWPAVLQELARQTALQIRVEGPLAGTLTVEFEALPLEQGLRRLFREVNRVFFYAPAPQQGSAAPPVLGVWLFARDAAADIDRQATPPPEPSLGEEGAQSGGEPTTAEDERERLDAPHAFAVEGQREALQSALFMPHPAMQAMAFDLLARQDRQEAVGALLDATASEEPMVRLHALHLLRQTGQGEEEREESVLAAIGQALADEDPNVRGHALHVLAERGGPEALEHFRQALRDPDPALRSLVVESVAQALPGEQSISLLQEALLDADDTVRSLAASWLEAVLSEGR